MAPILDVSKDLSYLIKKQILATPSATALEDGNTVLTYAQLDERVSSLAAQLRSHGVRRDSLVGVLLGRSADYVIACLAALRAGGAFLVLELAYPPGLLADVIEDAKPLVIVTHRAQQGQVTSGVPLIVLDEEDLEVTINGDSKVDTLRDGVTESKEEEVDENDLEKLAFVSYSSGTTGKPKGIANPHRAPVRSYDLRFQLSDLGPGDRVACNVFFIWEILRPLLRGATVIAVPDDTSYDPVALVDLLASKKITETLMTPTLLSAVLSRHPKIGTALPDLKSLWLNGEVVTTELANRAMKSLPKTRLLNCYSASETHEIACGDIKSIIDHESPYCPVGPPVEPEYIYILDEDEKRVEPGTSGELFVGGTLLARGYLNLPGSTAKAFIPDPFHPEDNARMYRTGDLARMLPSGVLEITGRVGAMLKIRGYSVVPAKVEHAIATRLAVTHCAVIGHGEGLDKQLVAYIVRDKDAAGDRATVVVDDSGYAPAARKILSEVLAQYMIPALWIELEELPTHEVSGKVDLKKLPDPALIKSQKNGKVAERDNRYKTKTIADLWATALHMSANEITPEHNFFDLGGHSLTLADLANRLSRTFNFPVPVARLVVNPTLEGHLEVVRSIRDGRTAAIQADLPAVLRADSVLDDEIQANGAKFRPANEAKTILLTGVTGFLGPFILEDLIKNTSARILCLIRFMDPHDSDKPAGIARLRRNLLDYGLWHDSILHRIEVLPGTLSRKRFGLTQATFDKLAENVDYIVHAGATVNLVYPYGPLRNANVGGTREVLRLASKSGATVQYISTNGILPPSDKSYPEESMVDVDAVQDQLVDGYGQSKWVAEKLVHAARDRGMPVRVIRLGTISGHSVSGSTNNYDLFTAIIVESLHLGYSPDIENWRAEMTPVDYVSKAIITLANHPETEQLVYHIGDPDPVQTQSLFSNLAQLGYPTKTLPWNEWVTMWRQTRGSAKGGDGVFTVDILRGGMPSIEFLQSITVLDNAQTKPALAGIDRPAIDIDLLETYARNWYGRGWLPKPPSREDGSVAFGNVKKKGPLAGKVAVVTGASSGIGAAVAEALAKEGAHIALAARRTPALEKLKLKLTHHGVKILMHQTDVTSASQVESLMKTATAELGEIDILVSCAGVMYFTMMANTQTDDWERIVDVNCKGLLHCLASTIPSFLSRGKGHIVAISSDAGRKVFPGLGVYSASKFFVEATLQALRVETAGSGLRVTSVQPGNTNSELLGMSTDQEALKKYGEPSGAKVLDPEDVARSIIYALSQPEHVAVNEVMIEPRDEPI